MFRRVAGKILSVIISLFVVSLAIFLILDLLPGDPAAILLGTSAREDTLEALRHEMGLDMPLPVRYLDWLIAMLQGDFGTSLTYHVPVLSLVADRLWVTLPLTFLAIVFAAIIGIGSGSIAAFYRQGLFDRFARAMSHLGLAIPNFCLGLILILLVSVTLGWLPAGGFPGWSSGLMEGTRALVLPAIALSCSLGAVLFRVSRSVMIDMIRADFVRTAFAKGVSRPSIIWRHALPNALHPILTVLGLQISLLIAGAILIESLFALPGMGQLVLNAMVQRDFVVLRTMVLFLSGAVILINGGIDLLQMAIDPRLRAGR